MTATQQYGKQGQTKAPHSKTTRLLIIIAIALAAMQCGTQYAAHQFMYDEALGFNVGGIYPPYMIAVWYLKWGSDPAYAKPFEFAIMTACVIGTIGLFAMLIIGNVMKNSARAKSDLHGTAKFAEFDDIVEAALLPHPDAKDENGQPVKHEGVYVGGWVNPKTKKMTYLRHNGPEHVICYAPTRSGKGVGLVNPTLLSWRESCIITDIKGELWELTSGWRQKYAKNKVIRFEPASTNSAKWNVFDSIRFGTDYEQRDVGNVAGLIVDPDGKGLEDHWAKTANALLIGCILHVHYKAMREPGCERSLAAVDALLANPSKPIAETWKEMKEYKHIPAKKDKDGKEIEPAQTHPTIAQTAQDMIDRAEAEGASVLSTAKSYLSLYRDPVIKNNSGTSDFTIHQIANMDDPVSLYIITKPADITRIRPIFRLMLTLVVGILADELEARNGRMYQKNKHRTLLMLDEFPALGKLDVMQKALAFISGFGLKAYLITQDLNQLYAAYGKEETITSNCYIEIAFPPGRMETAKYISEKTGKTTVIKEQVNVSGKRTGLFQNNVSITKQEQARNLLTEDEVLRLPAPKKDANGNITKPGHMLIFCQGKPAIYGEQILYFKDKAFLARAQIPAPAKTDSIFKPYKPAEKPKEPAEKQGMTKPQLKMDSEAEKKMARHAEERAKLEERRKAIKEAKANSATERTATTNEYIDEKPLTLEESNEAFADIIKWEPKDKDSPEQKKDTAWAAQPTEQIRKNPETLPDKPTNVKDDDPFAGQEFV